MPNAKRLPAFEVSSSYERYAQGDIYVHIDKSLHDDEPPAACEERPLTEEERQEALDRQVSEVVSLIGSQNALSEILYKTLVFCEEARDLDEAEEFIATSDEMVYSHLIQTPFTLINMLTRHGGLVQTPYDADGAEVTDERLVDLTDDEADDLIESWSVQTTPAGCAAAELLSPARRIESQLAQKPKRRATYLAVLDFCREPRRLPEIEEFFKASPNMEIETAAVHHKLSPDFYVDRLDKCGALVWRGAWVATDAGMKVLEQETGTSSMAVTDE